MREIITKVYTFNELSDQAKEKAREWYRHTLSSDDYYAECTIKDADTIAALFGLAIDRHDVRLVGGKTRQDPSIWWQLGYGQGDGASFDGVYTYKKDALEAVKAYAPTDARLHAIVEDLQKAQAPYLPRAGTLSAECRGNHGRMYFTVEYTQGGVPVVDATEIDEKSITAPLRDFARWIYDGIREEYECQNADAQVDETIRVNGYEFTEDGKRA